MKGMSKKASGRARELLEEFLVVVVGILVAFLLNGWASGQADREREQEYLRAVAADLRADLAELDQNAAFGANRFRFSEKIVLAQDEDWSWGQWQSDWLALTRRKADSAQDCEFVIDCVTRARIFDGSRGAFDTMTGSGDLHLLTNAGLATRLSQYYAFSASEIDADASVLRPKLAMLADALNRNGISEAGIVANPTVDELAMLIREDPGLRAAVVDNMTFAVWQTGRAERHKEVIAELLEAVQMEIR